MQNAPKQDHPSRLHRIHSGRTAARIQPRFGSGIRRLFFLIGILAVLGIGLAHYGYSLLSGSVIKPIPELNAGSIIQPTPTPDPLRPVSILLMGYGGGAHDGTYLTDTMIVLRIDPKTKRTVFISIPRDLWVQLPVGNPALSEKINAAYAIGVDDDGYPHKPVQYTGKGGGGALAKAVVGNVLGFPIDYYVAVSFAGFIRAIDVIGGVDILVPVSFTDPFYPIDGREKDTCGKSDEEISSLTATLSGELLDQNFSCRYEVLTFTKGLMHMDGTTALKYVRSRHSATDGTDFARSRRQQLLLSAIRDKVFSVQFLPKFIPFVTSITKDLATDADLNTIRAFMDIWGKPGEYSMASIPLTNETVLIDGRASTGAYILTPRTGEFNWTELQTYVATQAGIVK